MCCVVTVTDVINFFILVEDELKLTASLVSLIFMCLHLLYISNGVRKYRVKFYYINFLKCESWEKRIKHSLCFANWLYMTIYQSMISLFIYLMDCLKIGLLQSGVLHKIDCWIFLLFKNKDMCSKWREVLFLLRSYWRNCVKQTKYIKGECRFLYSKFEFLSLSFPYLLSCVIR